MKQNIIEAAFGDCRRLASIAYPTTPAAMKLQQTKTVWRPMTLLGSGLRDFYLKNEERLPQQRWAEFFKHVSLLMNFLLENAIDKTTGKLKMPSIWKFFKFYRFIKDWIEELQNIFDND